MDVIVINGTCRELSLAGRETRSWASQRECRHLRTYNFSPCRHVCFVTPYKIVRIVVAETSQLPSESKFSSTVILQTWDGTWVLCDAASLHFRVIRSVPSLHASLQDGGSIWIQEGLIRPHTSPN